MINELRVSLLNFITHCVFVDVFRSYTFAVFISHYSQPRISFFWGISRSLFKFKWRIYIEIIIPYSLSRQQAGAGLCASWQRTYRMRKRQRDPLWRIVVLRTGIRQWGDGERGKGRDALRRSAHLRQGFHDATLTGLCRRRVLYGEHFEKERERTRAHRLTKCSHYILNISLLTFEISARPGHFPK